MGDLGLRWRKKSHCSKPSRMTTLIVRRKTMQILTKKKAKKRMQKMGETKLLKETRMMKWNCRYVAILLDLLSKVADVSRGCLESYVSLSCAWFCVVCVFSA